MTTQNTKPSQEVLDKSNNVTNNNSNLSVPTSRWNRAIPEAGYVTLGTLRYGVRLSNPNLTKNFTHPSSSSISSFCCLENQSINSSTSSSNGTNANGNHCCCIGSSGLVLPWHNNCNVRTRLPVPDVDAKNRTSSPSSSSLRAAASSVSFIRDSSPTTSACCYNKHSKKPISIVYTPKHIKRKINKSEQNENIIINSENNCSENVENSTNVTKKIDENFEDNSFRVTKSDFNLNNNNHVNSDVIDKNNCCSSINTLINSNNKNINNNNSNLDNHNEKILTFKSNGNEIVDSEIYKINNNNNENNLKFVLRKLTPKFPKRCDQSDKNNIQTQFLNSKNDEKIDDLVDSLDFIDSIESINSETLNNNNSNSNSHKTFTTKSVISFEPIKYSKFNLNKTNNNVNKNKLDNECSYTLPENSLCFDEKQKLSNVTETTTSKQPLKFFKENNNINQTNKHYIKISTDSNSLNCFGKTNNHNSTYARISTEKTPSSIMDKRRNTLDRLQKFGFGRKASNINENKSVPNETKNRKSRSTDKTEKLKELTELLRGTRSHNSPPPPPLIPPPIPPPRRPRPSISMEKTLSGASNFESACGSIDEVDLACATLEHDQSSSSNSNFDKTKKLSSSTYDIHLAQKAPSSSLYKTLRPISSVSNLESLLTRNNSNKSSSKKEHQENSSHHHKPESSKLNTHKSIPFRSASFSQVDYSSGKYIRSALGAIKAAFSKEKETSVVDSANLTLPRNKSHSKAIIKPCDSIEFKFTDFGSTEIKRSSLEISLETQDENIILEEKSIQEDLFNQRICDNETNRCEPKIAEIPTDIELFAETNIAQTSEITLETLTEEEFIPIDTPTEDSFLQTATTCLIPVPVYECVVRDWHSSNSTNDWINVKEEDSPLIEEIGISLDMIQEINECDISSDAVNDIRATSNIENIDSVDSVLDESIYFKAPGEPIIEIVSENLENINTGEENTLDDEKQQITTSSNNEFVEVRKRQENLIQNQNEFEQVKDKTNVPNGEEKRRIDKSRRRKGIYIQWPTLSKNAEDIDSDNGTDENVTPEDGSISVGWECEKPDDLFLIGNDDTKTNNKLKILSLTNPSQKRDSECSMEPATPELEISSPLHQMLLLRYGRRKSLTCQSSDEKDDIQSTHSPSIRACKNSILFLRQDSISDNENERTPPRERSSASPAPHGDDLKRYSKRPLRGPYGQMLEAEMKKPGKILYDELLEGLNRQEHSLSPSPATRERNMGNHSFDETNSSLSDINSRKNKSQLPIPCHIRAASTPSQMDSLINVDQLVSHHKRYPSSIEPFSSNENNTVSSSERKVNEKKLSLDSSDKFKKLNESKRNSCNDNNKPKRNIDERSKSETTKQHVMPTPELLEHLLKGSSERLISEQRQKNVLSNSGSSNALPTAVLNCLDTRTHVVVELYNTEKSYVESLQTVIQKYFEPLKAPENAGIVDSQIVDEIFFKVPAILNLHKLFLDELKKRLDLWDSQQKIGDAFVEIFSKASVLETYTSFVNNWNKAKDAIRSTSSTRPQFARFLEAMTREHKRKLSLDNLLIKPVQKFPNYELIFQRLIKHTDVDHPDQKPLQDALRLVHDILLHLNCKEKEALENGQRESFLRELEGVIEGISDLVNSERKFLLFDLVSMPSAQAPRKERGLFLFSDILVITSIKRRSGTIKTKPNLSCPGSVAQTLDTNKYKFLTKISLDDLEIVKAKDENLRRIIREIENLSEDCNKLTQIADLASSLKYPHQTLEETIRDLQREVQRQLCDRQSNDSQLCLLELTVNLTSGTQNMSLVFSKPDKRNQWEEVLNDSKQKLIASLERYPIPEFYNSIPIRKTRAGLQFTCAAATLGPQHDVWVCNSDGYVGQVCVMSLVPEPTVTSCNGVCNARIMCIASVPASLESSNPGHGVSISIEDTSHYVQNNIVNPCLNVVSSSSSLSDKQKQNSILKNDSSDIQLDSDSSSDDSEAENPQENNVENVMVTPQHQHQDSNSDESDGLQATMWLGTEDGCIHVYNCNDNIRTKKNKIKIQHITAVYSILYLENRVFVSLANGDVCIYFRDQCGWNTNSPLNISIGTVTSPVTKLLNVQGRLWCAIQGIIKVLNISTLQIENHIQISNDSKPITNMTVSLNLVWISIQNSAIIKCFHSNTYELLFEVNLAPSVNKMLSNCDDIIRQHKAACLRVTSLLACKDLIWVGTSAGVLLTISSQNKNNSGLSYSPIVTGIPHGHTGHVRFLTYVENEKCDDKLSKGTTFKRISTNGKQKKDQSKLLVISGGDGYEDFRSSGTNLMSEIAGREDSTNHLLLWHV